MNKKLKKFRNKNRSHQELIEAGFSLNPQRKKKQCKDCIMHIETGNNGRRYYRTEKMTKIDKSIFDKAEKLKKAGKEVYHSYEPIELLMEFMKRGIDVKAKKDRYGNIHISVTKTPKKTKQTEGKTE